MAHYTMVSDKILKDMLSAKSKITDLKYLVDEYSNQLKQVGVLDKINEILYSRVYETDDE